MAQSIGWIALLAGFVFVRLPMALFFGFVGFNKTFATLADLARYGSWTVHIPEPLGRAVGVSEIACAMMLALPGWSRHKHIRIIAMGAGILVINQLVAALVHATHGETSALPQNGVLIAILLFLAWASQKLAAKIVPITEGD